MVKFWWIENGNYFISGCDYCIVNRIIFIKGCNIINCINIISIDKY